MTEDYASAMVTVIPIVLLTASLEFTAIIRSARDRQTRYRAEVLAAVKAGAPEPARASRLTRYGNRFVALSWYYVALCHVLAEMELIKWLAGSERGADPVTARFVEVVGIVGFFWVMLAIVSVTGVLRAESKAERLSWQGELARERAARAAAVPVCTVPEPTVPPPPPLPSSS